MIQQFLVFGIYTKKLKADSKGDIFILMFIAVLFIIAKTWKHPSVY